MALSKIDGTNFIAPTIPVSAGGTGSATLAGAGLVNTPSFEVNPSGQTINISNDVDTVVIFTNEIYDSDSAYDTSNGRFTPQTAGKYFITATALLDSDSNSNLKQVFIELYKNSSVMTEAIFDHRSGENSRRITLNLSAVVDMNGSSDFILIQAYIQQSSGGANPQVGDMSTFQAVKIIE